MDALMVDGNAVAGLLQEVFAVEVTTALGTCGTCGATDAVGATQVFRGAGIVMRCPHCDNPLVTIVRGDTGVWIGVPRVRTLQVTSSLRRVFAERASRGARHSSQLTDGLSRRATITALDSRSLPG